MESEDQGNFHSSGRSFVGWIRWIIFGFTILYLIFTFRSKKQNKKIDVKTRLWRRFIFTNGEILPHLTDEEKNEMLTVYNTTVENVQLLQKSKSEAKIDQQKTKIKNKNKKVTFQLQ